MKAQVQSKKIAKFTVSNKGDVDTFTVSDNSFLEAWDQTPYFREKALFKVFTDRYERADGDPIDWKDFKVKEIDKGTRYDLIGPSSDDWYRVYLTFQVEFL